MAAAWSDVPATGGLSECAALVRSAEALRTSAPELGVQFARRALLIGVTDTSSTTAHTGEARTLAMRAQAVLASGLVRISQHVGAVEPGFAALALAESGGALVLAAELRLDLAACAQELGEPQLGGALLRPVLEATQAPPSVRAAALGRLVGCIAHVARRDDVEDALAEADRLLAADDGVNPDARRMERATLAVRSAAYHRWYGDNEDAVTAARDGLNLLGRLSRELRPESDRLHARLVLELVCALLDEGELSEAEDVARPTVDEPVRATSAESVGQLMLAMATRVHLPAGEVDRGRVLLDQAAWLAQRHSLDSLLADALTEVSRLDEQADRVREALEAMRSARAAEQRRMRAVARAARHLLVQVGAGQGARDITQQSVAALLRQLAHPAGVPVSVAPPPSSRSPLPTSSTSPEPEAQATQGAPPRPEDERTNLLNREDLVRRLRSVRTGERPVALTLVRFEPNNDNPDQGRGPDTGIMVGLADKVRDIAPENAELARSDGGELAVLMPHTTRDQAEEFAATIRETATKSDWLADGSGKDLSISTSVVQSDPQPTDPDTQLDATGMLTAARDALTPTPHAPATPHPPATPSPPVTPHSPATPSASATPHPPVTPSASATLHPPVAPSASATPHPPVAPQPPAAGPSPNSLAETKAALSALSQSATQGPTSHPDATRPRDAVHPTATTRPTDTTGQQAPAHPGGETAQPHSALTEEPRTVPLHSAASNPRAGRSILSNLAIPSGSGGRRRADGEPAPGSRTRRPTDSPDAPRLTRAERRAQEQTSQADPTATSSSSGWPAEPDISQPLRRTTEPPRPTPETSQAANPTYPADPTHVADSTHAGSPAEPSVPPRLPELKTFGIPEPTTPANELTTGKNTKPRTDWASSYEETRAELARMMSALNAKALRSRTKADTEPSTAIPDEDAGHHPVRDSFDLPAMADSLAPRQTIPTPPEPDDMPEPPSRPDIPEPPSRPDIPEPPDPDPIPPLGPEPGEPPREGTRSRLMAAFDALTGPVLSSSDEDQNDAPSFRTNFDSGAGLPSRKPLKSWAELQSSAVVESPADDLFGAPGELPPAPGKSSLSDAFADFDIVDRPHYADQPATPTATAPSPAAPPPTAEPPAPTTERSAPTDPPAPSEPPARNQPLFPSGPLASSESPASSQSLFPTTGTVRAPATSQSLFPSGLPAPSESSASSQSLFPTDPPAPSEPPAKHQPLFPSGLPAPSESRHQASHAPRPGRRPPRNHERRPTGQPPRPSWRPRCTSSGPRICRWSSPARSSSRHAIRPPPPSSAPRSGAHA